MAAIYDANGNYAGEDSNGGTTTVVANPPNPPTTNTVPNTTTNTKKTVYQTAAKDSAVSPASDPSQFPAYDDEGNLQPGFKINEETGQTYYAGVGQPTTQDFGDPYVLTNQSTIATPLTTQDFGDPYVLNNQSTIGPALTKTAGFDPAYDEFGGIDAAIAAQANTGTNTVSKTKAQPVNDPLAGLTPAQVEALGGADPTDPYIRARLGIPQLPGSTLAVTSGFGFGNLITNISGASTAAITNVVGFDSITTNFPSIDNALGTIRSLFSSPTQPTAITTTRLTETETAAATTGTTATTVSALVDTPTSVTTLTADQSDAFYNGTGALTTAQQTSLDQQTAVDAAILYPGTNNEALRQIDIGASRIAENEAGIARAEQIIAQNNDYLSSPLLTEASRAELLANNEAQYEYIQTATENSIIQQNIIEQNAEVYAAGGGNPGDGQTPTEVSALVDTSADLANKQATIDDVLPTEIAPTDVDPFSDVDLINLQDQAQTDLLLEQSPESVDIANDADLAAQDAALQDQAQTDLVLDQLTTEPDPVDPLTDEEIAAQDAALQDQALTDLVLEQAPEPVDPESDEELQQRVQDSVNADATTVSALFAQDQGSQQAAIVAKAKNQATVQARYKQPGNQDWRVRLSLAPGAQYLYNATPAGPLAPLRANGGTDGVIFPYTPSITTTYSANYEQYDLIHSNYRGLFYKNSRVGDIQLRGTFTAQDTTEANYLLAVIHFFRSATKMFYGQDAERGTPPPICLLNGFGGYQFSDHPVVISSFNYTLPNDVDYIRTTNPNNFGLNLVNRYNPSGASLPAGGALAGLYRLLNAVPGGLSKGALPRVPAPNTVAGSVTNNVPASYVPTKMEIDVTLIPVQSRSQVSQQFSLKGFANGDLLKGGFW